MNGYGKELLETQLLLVVEGQDKPCPSFYGKVRNRQKVYNVLKEEIHPEVKSKWGEMLLPNDSHDSVE